LYKKAKTPIKGSFEYQKSQYFDSQKSKLALFRYRPNFFYKMNVSDRSATSPFWIIREAIRNYSIRRIIIAGTRTFNSYDAFRKQLNEIIDVSCQVEIVSGAAKGVDTLAIMYAEENSHKLKLFPADWEKYGKSAGAIRNKEMAEYGDMLIAFWDGESRGTKMMIEIAKKKELPVIVIPAK